MSYLTNIAIKKAAQKALSAQQRLLYNNKTSSLCDSLSASHLRNGTKHGPNGNLYNSTDDSVQRLSPSCNDGDNVFSKKYKKFIYKSKLKNKIVNLYATQCALPLNVNNASNLHLDIFGFHNFRFFHSSTLLQESKVGETLEAIKETIKKEQQILQQPVATQAPDVAPIDITNIATSSTISTPTTSVLPKPVPDATITDEKQSSPPPHTAISSLTVPMMQSNIRVRLVPPQEVSLTSQTSPKPPLMKRIINELKHYYHGFRLLYIDVKVSLRLIWAVLNGKTLMRREKKQLVRTTADLFRLVPFLVFIIVPFAEFLLPVFLKFFPGMLPSTFKEDNSEQDKKRKRLKLKLEMAKFLQDTIEETALQRKDARGESVHEFVEFMNKIRLSGVQTSTEEILKFSKLFEDSITLDNLNYAQLRAMCQLLEITPVGPSYILRFQLEMKLRELEADDRMIQQEGIDNMATWELQDACRQRGMRSFGVPEERLKSQLQQWLELHLNMKIPTSLLLLSRTLYFPEHLSTEDQLKATILALPSSLTEEAKVKILETSGDRVDNKSKLEVIKQEEMLIKMEKLEVEGIKDQKVEPKKVEPIRAPDALEPAAKVLADKPTSLDQIVEKEEIHTKDLEKLEEVLELVVDSKSKMTAEVEDLKNLKEEFTEYKQNLDQLKGVIESSVAKGETPLVGLEESKAAKRLTKKVEKMIAKLDSTVETLTAETAKQQQQQMAAAAEKVADAAAAGGRTEATMLKDEGIVDRAAVLGRPGDNVPDLSAKEMLDKQSITIAVSDLLSALESLKKDPDAKSKYETITQILDEDQDGLINYQEALKFIELLGSENLKIGPEKMADIMKTLKKEKEVLEKMKLMKQQQLQQQQQQQPQYHTPEIPNPTNKGDDAMEPTQAVDQGQAPPPQQTTPQTSPQPPQQQTTPQPQASPQPPQQQTTPQPQASPQPPQQQTSPQPPPQQTTPQPPQTSQTTQQVKNETSKP